MQSFTTVRKKLTHPPDPLPLYIREGGMGGWVIITSSDLTPRSPSLIYKGRGWGMGQG